MKKINKKIYLKKKRFLKKILGSKIKPRLSIFRSNKHIYAQLINDEKGHTIVSSSTLEDKKNIKNISFSTKTAAFLIGQILSKKSLQKNINNIVFDRNYYRYHGRIKSLIEGIRSNNLIF